jgi:hypothetical protein
MEDSSWLTYAKNVWWIETCGSRDEGGLPEIVGGEGVEKYIYTPFTFNIPNG